MQPSGLQGSPATGEQRKLRLIIEYLFLVIGYISVMVCLARSDYNFAFAIFGYYLWISKEDKSNSMMLIGINVLLVLMDVIWLSSVGSIWGEKSENKLWEELHGIHSFAIIFSVVNIFTKGGLILALYMYRQKQIPPELGSQIGAQQMS